MRSQRVRIPLLRLAVPALALVLIQPSAVGSEEGLGAVRISGELRQWHKVVLTQVGPYATEQDAQPNPFLDYRMTVRFIHHSGAPSYEVPGYFAADGVAAETSAEAGSAWRAHLAPDKPGRWDYRVSFQRGPRVAVDPAAAAEPVAGCEGRTGSFEIGPSEAVWPDFRARGRLEYVGRHHLRFAGNGEYFLKVGADSPENLLAYEDFDGTVATRRSVPGRSGEAQPFGLHRFAAHANDWRPGDPGWKGGKGRALLGALNYLSASGANAVSFLTYNAGGDGDDVWPFVARTAKLHYDCSKLDQWQVVFDHAQAKGLFLHFKLQETENDDCRNEKGKPVEVPTALDGGALGVERKLYLRELVARYGYLLALNWNLGEENTQSPEEQRAMAQYLQDTDPYPHSIVVHTYPDQQDKVYPPLLGGQSVLTGASLQNSWDVAHQRVRHWLRASAAAGRPWVVANDEQNPPGFGVPPDAADPGRASCPYTADDIRRFTLWGTLMAGGAGVEYYFGYELPHNDLRCEDWRSRAASWEFGRIALGFMREHRIPFWEMESADERVDDREGAHSRYCLALPGRLYLVYLPRGGTTALELTGVEGDFDVRWFRPRRGGPLATGTVSRVRGGARAELGEDAGDPGDDRLAVVRRVAAGD